jgi:hypothetical protein
LLGADHGTEKNHTVRRRIDSAFGILPEVNHTAMQLLAPIRGKRPT